MGLHKGVLPPTASGETKKSSWLKECRLPSAEGKRESFPPHRYHAMWDYSWGPGATYSLSMSAWEWRRPWFLRARMLKCTRVNTCILHQLFASDYISSTSNCFSDTFIMKLLERYGPTGTRMFTGAGFISCAPCPRESVPEHEGNKLKAFRGGKNDSQEFEEGCSLWWRYLLIIFS